MYYKLELIIGQEAWDVTDCLVNWDEVEVSYARSNYDGVMRSFTNKFEFAGDAFVLITDEYRKNYLQAQAKIVYYTRNNSWLWNERFRCSLDFATLTYTTTTCEINAVDDSLASLIKAKKGTQYEYSVGRIKDGKKLMYDRLEMTSETIWLMTGDTIEEEGGTYITNVYERGEETAGRYTMYSVPIYVKTSELAVKGIAAVNDVKLEYTGNRTSIVIEKPFFQNLSKENIYINLKCRFRLYAHSEGNGTCRFYLIQRYGAGIHYIHTQDLEEGVNFIDIDMNDYQIKGGGLLGMFIGVTSDYEIYQMMPYASDETLEITFQAKEQAVEVDVVKPVTLLNRLLQSMNGGMEGFTGEIAASSGGRLEHTVLAAADSVRGLGSAKLYTSYNKFCTWMEAEFGYVPVVDDAAKKVTFVHRGSLFKDVEVKDLGDGCTDFEFRLNESLIYARVRAGYDRQDYESVNGRDEWRFTSEYSTGVTLTENALELISPYRADAYGIEFLAAKRGEETTDDESDNDVFMIGVTEEEEQYVPMRGGEYTVEGVISPETMFNVMYSQRYMLAANAGFLGVFAKKLERTSAEGNGEVTVGGVREDADVTLPEGLFSVGELSATTGDTELPEDLGGYVKLKAGGLEYTGYVKEVGVKYGREEAVSYELIVRS